MKDKKKVIEKVEKALAKKFCSMVIVLPDGSKWRQPRYDKGFQDAEKVVMKILTNTLKA